MDRDIIQYYGRRGREYEKIYQKPERQNDLKKLKEIMANILEGRDVLEIACGTGYWTQFVAQNARSICGIDDSEDVLTAAAQKAYGKCRVIFVKSNAYRLDNVEGHFDGGFCGFWWSHIPLTMRTDFLETFHSKLTDGAHVVMIDNLYVEGGSTPISRTDSEGNTYQIRKLEDGSQYEILKNYPSEQELKALLSPCANKTSYTAFEYYWLVQYNVLKNP